jgi:hypothetical protein
VDRQRGYGIHGLSKCRRAEFYKVGWIRILKLRIVKVTSGYLSMLRRCKIAVSLIEESQPAPNN